MRTPLEVFSWLGIGVCAWVALSDVRLSMNTASRDLTRVERFGVALLASAALLLAIGVARWTSRPRTLRQHRLAARDPHISQLLSRRSMSSAPATLVLGILAALSMFVTAETMRAWIADDAGAAGAQVAAGVLVTVTFFVACWYAGVARIRARQREEDSIALDPAIPFVLLLRPFSSDGSLTVANPLRGRSIFSPSYYHEAPRIPLERWMAAAVKPDFQLRALGGAPSGPGIVFTEVWKDEFRSLARAAQRVAVVALPGKELIWELGELRGLGFLDKTAVIVPRVQDTERISREHADFLAELRSSGFELPKPTHEFQRVLLGPRGEVQDVRPVTFGALRDVRGSLGVGWPAIGTLARADMLGAARR